MLDRLYDLSDFWVLLIFAGFALVAFTLAPIVGHRLGWSAPDKDRADYVMRGLTTITSLAAVILAFSLVQVNGNLRRTEELVAKEASQIDLMDRLLQRYGGPDVAALRGQLRAYAASIVRDEWPALQANRQSPQTDERLQAVMRGIAALAPSPAGQRVSYSTVQQALDSLSDLRDQRLAAAELTLPHAFWYLILALILLMVGLSAMIEPAPFHTIPIAAKGLAIVLLAALVFMVDTPLKGEIAVAPMPFEKALAAMTARG